MPSPGEPDAGRGTAHPITTILGGNPLTSSMNALTLAVKENTQERRSESSLNPVATAVHAARFAGNPEAQRQWEDRLNTRAAFNQEAQRQRDRSNRSQAASTAAGRASMRAQLNAARRASTEQFSASAAANGAPPDLAFPKTNGGYQGGVPSKPTPAGANTSAPPWVSGNATQAFYGQGGALSVPWQASGAPANPWGSIANGGTQAPRPPLMKQSLFGSPTPTPTAPAGGSGGGAAGGGGGGGAGGGGGKSFLSENKGMIGVGLAAGAINALGGVIQNYSTRMLNTNYDQFGNLVVLRNGGYSGMTYGDASSQGIDKLRASRFIATSPADLINGGSQILANSSNATFGQNLTNAGVSAYLTPGMGLGQAATNMQQEGSNRANVMSMMMFGTGTRLPGGGQLSEVGLANAALNATRGGQGMAGMTPEKLAAMLAQGGTLRTNLNTYAQNAGLGPEAVQSLADILQAQTAYQNKYGTTADFEATVTAASQGNRKAQDKLKGTGIGESVEQSILNRQGSQINRDMDSQKSYIDSIKTLNKTMERLNDLIERNTKGALSDAMGWIGGKNAASGGRVSGAMKYGASGAMLGMMAGPEGALIGGALGSAYGFVFGGAAKNVAPNTKSTQSATPAPTSGAANIAVQYAEAQVGKPYVSGGTGPNSYDCSGLMQTAFKQAGVSIPRVSSQQAQFGKVVPLDQIAPGDLIFPRGYDGMNGAPAGLPGHVMMALGSGPNVPVVQAANPSVGVINSTISVGDIELVRRMTNGVGTLSPTQNNNAAGGTTTNTSTSAGTSQQTGAGGASGAGTGASGAGSSNGAMTAGGASGMNEVDVLGSVLGRAAFQSPGTAGSSMQQGFLTTLNGTAGPASYAKGSYSIDGDQIAELHDQEMVLDRKSARAFRSALMADVPSQTAAGRGASITFASGAIQVTVNGAMTSSAASNAAKQIADAIAADSRIQQIGAGL